MTNDKKKSPPVLQTQKSSTKTIPSKVYHIIKPKGQHAMIELKITTETAEEITTEIQALAKQVTGAHVCDCKDGKLVEAPVVDEPVKAAPKKSKAKKKAEPVVEETPKAEPEAQAEPVVEEASKEESEPVAEETPAETKTYTVDEVRAAVKAFAQKAAENKDKVAAFLHDELNVKSVTMATPEQYPRIMAFVGAE